MQVNELASQREKLKSRHQSLINEKKTEKESSRRDNSFVCIQIGPSLKKIIKTFNDRKLICQLMSNVN
jgi:hypothetical protein